MTKPIASIKVLTYNHEKFIGRCLDSLLKQKTEYPYEIVVGDDGSADGTRDILLEYQSRYPHKVVPVISETNKGSLHNSFKVTWATKGKYQLVCDGDDYWIDPLKLQKQVAFMEDHPDYSMIHADMIFVDEKGREQEPSPYFIDRKSLYRTGDVFWSLWDRNFINTNTVCLRNDFYKALTPNTEKEMEKMWFIHDYWYWLLLAKMAKVGFINEKMAAYRTHAENITVKGNFLQKRLPMVFIDVARSLSKQEADTREKREEIAKKMIWILMRKDLPVNMKMKAFSVLLKYFPAYQFIIKNLKRRV